MKVLTQTLLDAVIANGDGSSSQPEGPEVKSAKRSFHAYGATSAGAGAADVAVQGSHDGTNWVTIDTMSLVLGTTTVHDFYTTEFPWKYVRGSVSNLTGTDATVNLKMGLEGIQ